MGLLAFVLSSFQIPRSYAFLRWVFGFCFVFDSNTAQPWAPKKVRQRLHGKGAGLLFRGGVLSGARLVFIRQLVNGSPQSGRSIAPSEQGDGLPRRTRALRVTAGASSAMPRPLSCARRGPRAPRRAPRAADAAARSRPRLAGAPKEYLNAALFSFSVFSGEVVVVMEG